MWGKICPLIDGQNGNGVFGQGGARAVKQGRGVRSGLDPQTFARRAPAQRTVEGEVVGRQRLERTTTGIAHEVLAVDVDGPVRFGTVAVGEAQVKNALAQRQGVFDAFRDAAPGVGPYDDSIDDDLDLMPPATVDRRSLVEGIGLSVNANADISGGSHLVPQGLVFLSDLDFDGAPSGRPWFPADGPSPFR